MFREGSRKMLGQYAGATATPRYLRLEDFEREGVRVAERSFGGRDIIFSPGDPGGQLYFLLSGTVRLYKIYGAYKEATVALLKDGGVFGELGLDEGCRQSLFAEALTSVRVAIIRKSTLTEVIKRRPEFAMKLLFFFSDRLEQSDEVIDCLLDRGVATRLGTLLMNLGDRFGEANGSGTIIDVRLTHQDLANMISSTREAVSKEMSELQRNGIIETRNRRIILYPQLAKVS
jgi:CRP-like cAMP-binding protein